MAAKQPTPADIFDEAIRLIEIASARDEKYKTKLHLGDEPFDVNPLDGDPFACSWAKRPTPKPTLAQAKFQERLIRMREFVRDFCYKGPDEMVPVPEIQSAFEDFIDEELDRTCTFPKLLAAAAEQEGIKLTKKVCVKADRKTCYFGISLRPPTPPAPPSPLSTMVTIPEIISEMTLKQQIPSSVPPKHVGVFGHPAHKVVLSPPSDP